MSPPSMGGAARRDLAAGSCGHRDSQHEQGAVGSRSEATAHSKRWWLRHQRDNEHGRSPSASDASDLLAYLGRTTVSITWITPLDAAMSAFTTLALSIITTPFFVTIFSDCPFTVFAEESFIACAARTSPDTT